MLPGFLLLATAYISCNRSMFFTLHVRMRAHVQYTCKRGNFYIFSSPQKGDKIAELNSIFLRCHNPLNHLGQCVLFTSKSALHHIVTKS